MMFHKAGIAKTVSLEFSPTILYSQNHRNLLFYILSAALLLLNGAGVIAKPEPDTTFKWPWSTDTRDDNNHPQSQWDWSSQSHNRHLFDNDDEFDEMGSSIESIAVGVGIFILVAFIVTCLVCFCCPICIIAKMRQRRRGQVYRTTIVTNSNGNANSRNNAGQPAITTALHVQNAVAPNTNSPAVNCIAIANNSNTRNSPYPVQESVTVVPVITAQQAQPQAPPQQYYGHGHQQHPIPYGYQQNQAPGYQQNPAPGYQQNQGPNYPMSMPMPGQNMPNDLPPPYPGLSREMDAANLPYNPYFSGDESAPPSAPLKQ